MDNFAQHMFSDAAKAEQEKAGTKAKYDHVYQTRLTGGLGADEKAFIETRTSFYIASIVDSGYPYIQHRGGPAGFLQVMDPNTLGFADYQGNKQFITQGNLATHNKVSLILMDYPRRARLKMIGEARMIAADNDTALTEKLSLEGQGPVERLMTIKVTAIDWNCPQYITPRYTEVEIGEMLAPKMAEINRQIDTLAGRLKELGEDPVALLQEAQQEI